MCFTSELRLVQGTSRSPARRAPQELLSSTVFRPDVPATAPAIRAISAAIAWPLAGPLQRLMALMFWPTSRA